MSIPPADQFHENRFVILGAGPAGMGAAWELYKHGARNITVLDRNDRVGGLARTFSFNGYRFDVGPHRFLTKYPEVEALWKDTLGEDLLQRPRLTRIYYNGKFFQYPLKIFDVLKNLGLARSLLAGLSFLKAKIVWRNREPSNFAEWTEKVFGNRMSQAFFRTYLKKVWGIDASEVGTDWAGQRIKQLSIFDFFKKKVREFIWQEKVEDIGNSFYYPKYGAGTFYAALQTNLEDHGVTFLLGREITSVHHDNASIREIGVQHNGREERIRGDICISSIPTSYVIEKLEPAAPPNVCAKTADMRFRAHIAVNMIIRHKDLFPDSWLYIQSPDIGIARIGNYNAFSPYMIPDKETSAIGVEYYCFAGDDLWNLSDRTIIETAVRELASMGFIAPEEFIDAFVVRHRDAYPTYYLGYKEKFAEIRAYAETFQNLILIGRAGMYKYKDQDHAMYTGMLAVRNLFGQHYDVWGLGEEQEHFEEQKKPARGEARP